MFSHRIKRIILYGTLKENMIDVEDKNVKKMDVCTQVLVKQANPPMPVTASLKKAESLALGQIALFRSVHGYLAH